MANVDALLRAAGRKRYPLGEHLPIFRHDPDYVPLGPAQPNVRGKATVDGAVRHPVVGGGVPQHPILPLFKLRRPRRS